MTTMLSTAGRSAHLPVLITAHCLGGVEQLCGRLVLQVDNPDVVGHLRDTCVVCWLVFWISGFSFNSIGRRALVAHPRLQLLPQDGFSLSWVVESN